MRRGRRTYEDVWLPLRVTTSPHWRIQKGFANIMWQIIRCTSCCMWHSHVSLTNVNMFHVLIHKPIRNVRNGYCCNTCVTHAVRSAQAVCSHPHTWCLRVSNLPHDSSGTFGFSADSTDSGRISCTDTVRMQCTDPSWRMPYPMHRTKPNP